MAGWWATGRGPVIGREDEVAVLANFLAAGRDTSEALALDGEAGIGKSTLWLAGVEHAGAQGLRVLSSRPAEAEAASLMRAWAICSRVSWTTCCLRWRRRGGARSRSHSF